jgi:hypothetical protein
VLAGAKRKKGFPRRDARAAINNALRRNGFVRVAALDDVARRAAALSGRHSARRMLSRARHSSRRVPRRAAAPLAGAAPTPLPRNDLPPRDSRRAPRRAGHGK